jgi:hypothetical protein
MVRHFSASTAIGATQQEAPMLLRDSPLKRKLVCSICGAGLQHERVGRIRRYCSDRCRDGARRDREHRVSWMPATQVTKTHETVEKPPVISVACKAGNRGRAFALDLLGHGYKWPGAERLDPELTRKIVRAELGRIQTSATYRVEKAG